MKSGPMKSGSSTVPADSQALTRSLLRWARYALILLCIGALNVAIWLLSNLPVALAPASGKFSGVAYAPFRANQSPLAGRFPSEAEVRDDLKLLAGQTEAIRLYSVSELPELASWAAEYGLKVNLGAWLDGRHEQNQLELERLIKLAAQAPNVNGAIIGNETVLRGELSIAELSSMLDQARARLDIPVSTAENWDLWLAKPELAEHVDYLAVHILPYWEGVPSEDAFARAKRRLDELQSRFPDKPMVIAEYGWPSAGERFLEAGPSLRVQAKFAREFSNLLKERGIQGYLMEAADQPWKASQEGKVGAYWGMLDADRQFKWLLTGPVLTDPHWLLKAFLSTLLALPLVLLMVHRLRYLALWGQLGFALMLQLGCSLLVWLFGVPAALYLSALDWSMFLLLFPAQLAIVGILWIGGFEFFEAVAQKDWRRRFHTLPAPAISPMVSIHLPCYNEPPDMVMLTLDSLAALSYPNFEVLVVDNNTEREDIWQPVRAHCEKLGARFRFFHLKPWPGFKAGALNFALQHTSADAQIIAVVDSDYVVEHNWLRDLVAHFDAPKVVLVQCPQAHRDFSTSAFRRMCNFEYEGFFRIGMHHRNERNAIIQHGTMTMVRRSALLTAQGWAEWCICEDAELGLQLMQQGGETRYVDVIMGRGLTPADFAAYKSQRFRWAFGAMQILRRHRRELLGRELLGRHRSSAEQLTSGQRYHFLTGWFGWFADALHLVFSLLLMLWTLGMLLDHTMFSMPLSLFLVPVLGFCLVRAVFGIALYRARVDCSWRDCLGASLASMALSHAIARGVWKGLIASSHPFERTAKQRRLRKQPHALRAVREEALMLLGLWLAASAIAFTTVASGPEQWLWVTLILTQSAPYLAALGTAAIAARGASLVGRGADATLAAA